MSFHILALAVPWTSISLSYFLMVVNLASLVRFLYCVGLILLVFYTPRLFLIALTPSKHFRWFHTQQNLSYHLLVCGGDSHLCRNSWLKVYF